MRYVYALRSSWHRLRCHCSCLTAHARARCALRTTLLCLFCALPGHGTSTPRCAYGMHYIAARLMPLPAAPAMPPRLHACRAAHACPHRAQLPPRTSLAAAYTRTAATRAATASLRSRLACPRCTAAVLFLVAACCAAFLTLRAAFRRW